MPRPASAGRVTIEEAQRPRVRPTDRVTRTRRLKQRRQSPIGLSLEQVEDLELLDAAGKKADERAAGRFRSCVGRCACGY